ncbi:glycosyltransferase [candidate division KSB1 bacterium]|nr:glycosyltransferase [candidate division KSB1 bacterium]
MDILALSHLFPNSGAPFNGIFVKERLKYIARKVNLKVVAPIPIFRGAFLNKNLNIRKVDEFENFDSLAVYHPRYFRIPKFFKGLDPLFYQKSLNQFMQKYLNEKPVDLFDFHWTYPDAIAGLEWAERFNKKIFVTIRGNEAIYYFQNCKQRKILKKRLKEFDHIITVSNDLKTKIVDEYNVQPVKITVIGNGIDSDKFYHIDKNKARELCGLDQNRKYILAVNRLSEEKGIKYLLEAFAGLNDKNTDLIIIGDGPLKNKLQNRSKALKIERNVIFHDFLSHEQIYKWFNAADLHCLPSLWEGCPNVVIEALACGTPVISTQTGGIPDLVTSEEYGLLVKPGDADALTKALSSALHNKWNRPAISEFGRKNSWENVADKVIDVYKKVLQ